MYREIEEKLLVLEEATTQTNKTFDELLAENVALGKLVLGDDWLPLESDPYMKKLRVVTLRQLHNRVDKNETIKQLLTTTATKIDLDKLGAELNVFRDKGEYPYALFKFTLLTAVSTDTVIPAALILNSEDDIYKATLKHDVIIPAGELSATGTVELHEYIEQSEVKTEFLVSELTFGVEIKQLDIFNNGAKEESDHRYRVRIIASNDKHSTAGSEESYKYHTYSADSRINDVSIPDDNEALDVNIYIASFVGVDDAMIERVYKSCNKKYTRPLGDNLLVEAAEIIEVKLTGEIQVYDLLKQNSINEKIKANFKDSFFIGQNFTESDFKRKTHVDDVYKVKSSFDDVIVNNKQIIKIVSIDFNYVEVQ